MCVLQEGPNEHDLAMLDFGQVLAVVRTLSPRFYSSVLSDVLVRKCQTKAEGVLLLPPPPTQVRLDAGDGLASHPYVPYYYTISRDGGVTWPKVSSDATKLRLLLMRHV
eukprot:COSAG04_NODE_640_length_11672_cov_32.635358_7_plen_109_part_00